MILTLVACATLFLFLAAYTALVILSPKSPTHNASERTYLTPASSKPQALPSLTSSEATVELSVVVPAYNEKDRLGAMLGDAVKYLEERPLDTKGLKRKLPKGVELGSYEVLIVDDGSKDGTSQVALELAKALEGKYSQGGRKLRGSIKVVTLITNRGKGGSVKHGILHSAGHRILFVDADGASHFPDLELLEAEMDELELSQAASSEGAYSGGQGIVVGSRAHLVRTEAVVKVCPFQVIVLTCADPVHLPAIVPSKPSYATVPRLLVHPWNPTHPRHAMRVSQILISSRFCATTLTEASPNPSSFKLHTRQSAAHIYPYLHSPSWIFDCELLLLASISGIPAREVGIAWKEIEGSKVNLIRDSINMAIDLLVIRGNHLLGRWPKPSSVGYLGGVEKSSEGSKKSQ